MIRVGPDGRNTGLIETVRAGDGRIPFLERHVARLRRSVSILGMPAPIDDVGALLMAAAGIEDRVVRLELRDGRSEVMTRTIGSVRPPRIMVSDEVHARYAHKTTTREAFGRAFSGARRVGSEDAVLLTASGHVAEGTAWSIFWWQDGHLCTPAESLGILPGIGRSRIMEIADVEEVRARPGALEGHSLFLVNAVRGIVEIAAFQGKPVPHDPRTAQLSSRFWPD